MAEKRVIQYHFFATEEEAAEIEANQKLYPQLNL